MPAKKSIRLSERSRAGVKINWTKQDITFLRANWKTMIAAALAKRLRLRITTVRMKLYELGLRRFTMKRWTPGQVAFLRKNYMRLGDVELAEVIRKRFRRKMKWNHKRIRKKRLYLNLHRSAAQVRAVRRRNAEQGRYSNNSRTWEGRRAPVGDIRAWRQNGRTVLYVKGEKGFKPYLRELYKQTHGRIPAGYVVVPKDGNRMNARPSNLEIMKRSEMVGILLRYDTWVAAQLARQSPHAEIDRTQRDEMLKYPELIAAKRKQLELRRLTHGQASV